MKTAASGVIKCYKTVPVSCVYVVTYTLGKYPDVHMAGGEESQHNELKGLLVNICQFKCITVELQYERTHIPLNLHVKYAHFTSLMFSM